MAGRFATFALAAAAVATVPVFASAQSVRIVRPPSVMVPGAATARPAGRPHPKRIHILYGSIETLGKTTLLLLVRGHRHVTVDMTAALADGTYSAPLTIGKFVAAEGEYDANHVLFASNITRITRLDEHTGDDH